MMSKSVMVHIISTIDMKFLTFICQKILISVLKHIIKQSRENDTHSNKEYLQTFDMIIRHFMHLIVYPGNLHGFEMSQIPS